MEIKNLYTKTGGKVHVHFGSKCTTNLWGKYYEITDMIAVQRLCDAVSTIDPGDELIKVRDFEYPDPNMIGKPYVRQPRNNQSGNSFQTVIMDDIPTSQPGESTPAPAPQIPHEEIVAKVRLEATSSLMKFFTEFTFKPAARFVNTLSRQPGTAAARSYVSGYTKLINNPDATSIIEKIKSPEFGTIVTNLTKYPAEKAINQRLEIYFGDAGTGKTTKAVNEYPGAPIVPCNSSMLPDDLFRTFDFNDENGNPVFKPSALRLAMENGTPIIFDEINLLSFDCLRALQTITDTKESINHNGIPINIHPGFKVIGTMNLTVNDQVYNLPEPLVDRAGVIKEFTLTAEELTAYAFA